MTASYKIALAAGGLLLLIVISSLILRGETPADPDQPDGTLALNDTDRAAPAPGGPLGSDSLSADSETNDSFGAPLEPLPEPEIAPSGPPRRDSVGPPFGVSDNPATRINFIEDDAQVALPEPEENGFPTLDVGRRPFESSDPLFSNDAGVILTDNAKTEIAAAVEPQPLVVPRPTVAIGPTDPVVQPGSPGADTQAEPEPARREPPILRLYTVESGDSMSSIALATYGDADKWFDISQANPLIDPNRLKIGQEIKLPDLNGVGPDPQTGRSAEAAEEDQDLPRSGATYTIKSGDNLSTIAKQFYGSASKWELIYQANRRAIGDNPGRLKLGTELLIPPPANGAN